jgi:hypothetical protein
LNSNFGVLNSDFDVLNSNFGVPNSGFDARNPEIEVLNSGFRVLSGEHRVSSCLIAIFRFGFAAFMPRAGETFPQFLVNGLGTGDEGTA